VLNEQGDKKSDSPPDEVELTVAQEDYVARLKRGWTDDDMLKPGHYKFRRGEFLARHPELKIKKRSEPNNAKVSVREQPQMKIIQEKRCRGALLVNQPDSGLQRGDLGTVFESTADHPAGLIVEFVDESGKVQAQIGYH
jgi:hypothetical protein